MELKLMSDTYTLNDDNSWTVVSDDSLSFIEFGSFNPETLKPWLNQDEVKSFVKNHPKLWATYASLPSQEEQDEMAASINRAKRNQLLADSDWTQMNDSPLTDEAKTSWAAYRTALRDLTTHDNWPYLQDADWPTKP
jgi:hypothetical protein